MCYIINIKIYNNIFNFLTLIIALYVINNPLFYFFFFNYFLFMNALLLIIFMYIINDFLFCSS